MFPSHIGSRSTQERWHRAELLLRFPSHIGSRSTSMKCIAVVDSDHVSIPHWFSLNMAADGHSLQNIAFPSHIGSRSTKNIIRCMNQQMRFHPTLVLAQPLKRFSASIRQSCFHPTLVLAQRVFFCISIFDSHVSIPHWFSLNGARIKTLPLLQLKFPSHIGSRSTNWIEKWAFDVLTFPSHIGSRSTWQDVRDLNWAKSFHPTLVLAQPNLS